MEQAALLRERVCVEGIVFARTLYYDVFFHFELACLFWDMDVFVYAAFRVERLSLSDKLLRGLVSPRFLSLLSLSLSLRLDGKMLQTDTVDDRHRDGEGS